MTRAYSSPAKFACVAGFIVAAILAGGFAAVMGTVVIDRAGSDPTAGGANLQSLCGYWASFAALWVGLSAVLWRLSKSGGAGEVCGQGWRVQSTWAILGVALAARLVTVLAGGPQLSDDLWRYIHDGRQLAGGANPYATTPQELGAPTSGDAILDQINHPQLVTIYQPVSQYVFAALWLAHPQGTDPLAVTTFRLGFVLFDLWIIVLLLGWLRDEDRSPWWVIAYAWHPLVISEVAGSGHQDVIGIALLLASLRLVGRGRSSPGVGMAWLGGVAFAGALAVKPVVLPLAIPLLWAMRTQPRAVAAAGFGGMLAIVAVYLPFVSWGGGMGRLWDTAGAFVGTWSFNSSLHGPLVYITGSKAIAGVILGGGLLGVLWVCMARGFDVWRTATVFMFASLLFSSTAHPWYLLWALALAAGRFNWGIWVYSLTVCWSYAVLEDVVQWELPAWVVVVEYVPVYAVVAVELFRWINRHGWVVKPVET